MLVAAFSAMAGMAASGPPPVVHVLPVGWIAQQRFAAFVVSNAGPTLVALTPRIRLEAPSANGWATLTQTFLPSGGFLGPGQAAHLSVPIPPEAPGVRLVVQVQPSRRGHATDPFRNLVVSWMERLGASPLVPRTYEFTSGPLTRPRAAPGPLPTAPSN